MTDNPDYGTILYDLLTKADYGDAARLDAYLAADPTRAASADRRYSDNAEDLIAGGGDVVVVGPNAKSAAFGANVLDARTRRYGQFVPRPRAAGIAPLIARLDRRASRKSR